MGKSNMTVRQKTVQEIKTICTEFHNEQDLDFGDIFTWLNENINRYNKALSGYQGRLIADRGSYGAEVMFLEDIPFLTMEIEMEAMTSRGKHVDFTCLAEALPDISVNQLPPSKNPDYVGAKFTFDLTKWPNLVPALLAEKLYNALIPEYHTPAEITKYLDPVEMLLNRFYPTVALDLLKAAADVGLVDENPMVFITWFNQHVKGVNSEVVSLPYILS